MNNKFFKIANKSRPKDIKEGDNMLLWKDFATIGDYWFYAKGFFDATNLVLKQKSHNCSANDDKLAFPIIHNHHMFIELALKHFIYNIRAIYENRNGNFKYSEISHDLDYLLKKLKEVSMTDKRLMNFYNKIEPFVKDFYKQFPSANNTFRYPYKKEGDEDRYIKDSVVFSVSYFQRGLAEANILFEDFSYKIEDLKKEYKTKTWTKKLSRADIEDIAKQLPNHATWSIQAGYDEFLKAKEKIINKYKISNTELSKAIGIIKNHREFSKYIGIKPSLNFLKENDIKDLMAVDNERNLRLESKKQDSFFIFLESLS